MKLEALSSISWYLSSGREGPVRLPMPPRRRFAFAFLSVLLPLTACGRGPAYGSDNAIVAVVDPALRERVEPALRASLERGVETTRMEPVFEVTFTTPEGIGEFRKWKRLLVIEPGGEDAVLLPELVDTPLEGPVSTVVHDKWARGQTIYVLAAPTPEATAELVRASADSLYGVIHDQFVDYHVARMWASEPDSALAGRLAEELGFSVLLPNVYRPAGASAPADSRVWYNEDPRRVVSLHWLPRPTGLTADTLLALRREWGHQLFPGDSITGVLPAPAGTAVPADSLTEGPVPQVRTLETRLGGLPAIRLQGPWTSPSDVGTGLFVTYGVICGDRLVLLDGNLYAPDRSKYPYVVQLDRIFETFRCAAAGDGAA
ncbi:MAG TPA: DUF4837 family protein [Gemmatimonadota bacterium]|nr:DUF4837 family protein [Gemmatimonadota bacterium]